jgi:hypothetical protein
MDTTTKLNDKLIEIQRQLKSAKDKNNSYGKYNYRNAEGILDALKPLLSVSQASVTMSDTIERVGDRNYVKATVCLSDGVEKICSTSFAWEEARKGMSADQCTGSASSYARKYALGGLFLVSENSVDADDSDNTEMNYVSKENIDTTIKILDKAFDDGNTKKAKAIYMRSYQNNPRVTQVCDRYIMLFGSEDLEKEVA